MHRVKCDGEIFNIPGGHLGATLSHSGHYLHSDDSIDYTALKSAIKRERLPDEVLMRLPFEKDLGYLDFDLMEQNKSSELPAIGNYIMIVDRKQYDRISIVEHQEVA